MCAPARAQRIDDAPHRPAGERLVSHQPRTEALPGQKPGQKAHRGPAVAAVDGTARHRQSVEPDAVHRGPRALDLDRHAEVAEGLRGREVVEAAAEVRDAGAALGQRGEDQRAMPDGTCRLEWALAPGAGRRRECEIDASCLGDQLADGRDQPVVLFRETDGDAEPGVDGRRHGADDDALPEHALEDLLARLGEVDEQKVRLTRRDLQAEPLQLLRQPSALLAVERDVALHVRLIGERRPRGDLPQRADVERRAGAVEVADEVLRTDGVADAHRRQPVRLRERAQDEQPLAQVPELHGAHVVVGVGELHVRLVDHREHPLGQLAQELLERAPADVGAGRVVRVGHEEEAGLRADAVEHRVEIPVEVLAQRHGVEGHVRRRQRQLIDDEAGHAEDGVIRRRRVGAADRDRGSRSSRCPSRSRPDRSRDGPPDRCAARTSRRPGNGACCPRARARPRWPLARGPAGSRSTRA